MKTNTEIIKTTPIEYNFASKTTDPIDYSDIFIEHILPYWGRENILSCRLLSKTYHKKITEQFLTPIFKHICLKQAFINPEGLLVKSTIVPTPFDITGKVPVLQEIKITQNGYLVAVDRQRCTIMNPDTLEFVDQISLPSNDPLYYKISHIEGIDDTFYIFTKIGESDSGALYKWQKGDKEVLQLMPISTPGKYAKIHRYKKDDFSHDIAITTKNIDNKNYLSIYQIKEEKPLKQEKSSETLEIGQFDSYTFDPESGSIYYWFNGKLSQLKPKITKEGVSFVASPSEISIPKKFQHLTNTHFQIVDQTYLFVGENHNSSLGAGTVSAFDLAHDSKELSLRWLKPMVTFNKPEDDKEFSRNNTYNTNPEIRNSESRLINVKTLFNNVYVVQSRRYPKYDNHKNEITAQKYSLETGEMEEYDATRIAHRYGESFEITDSGATIHGNLSARYINTYSFPTPTPNDQFPIFSALQSIPFMNLISKIKNIASITFEIIKDRCIHALLTPYHVGITFWIAYKGLYKSTEIPFLRKVLLTIPIIAIVSLPILEPILMSLLMQNRLDLRLIALASIVIRTPLRMHQLAKSIF